MTLRPPRSLRIRTGLVATTLLVALLGNAGEARAETVVYVDKSASSGGNGSSGKPYNSLKTAVKSAPSGATVKVAGGTYSEGTVTIAQSLTLLGGFAGKGDFTTRDPSKFASVVVGSNATSDPNSGAVILVTDAPDGLTIDGFTVRGGRHGIVLGHTGSSKPLRISHNVIEKNGVTTPDYEEYGGGLLNVDNDVEIVANVVRNNISGRGAGMALSGPGKATVTDNVIEANIGKGDHGGGIFMQQPCEVLRNVFRSNETTGAIVDYNAGVGAGIVVSDIGGHLSGNVYTDNYAAKRGGAVFVDEGAKVTMDHELVYKNRPSAADGLGGSGLYVDGGGSGRSELHLSFSTIADNGVGGPGAGNGLFLTEGLDVTIESSIFWNNGDGDDCYIDVPTDVSLAISYSIFRTKTASVKAGDGMLTDDPLFFDAEHGDYHIKALGGRWQPLPSGSIWVKDDVQSPALDAANPAAPFDLEPRPNGGRANIGAYGNSAQASKANFGPGDPDPTDGGDGPDGSGGGGPGGSSSSSSGGSSDDGCHAGSSGSSAPYDAALIALAAFAVISWRRPGRSSRR